MAGFLPGMFPGGATRLSSSPGIVFSGSSTSTSTVISAPASINSGDVLFLLDRARSLIFAPVEVIPTGFTLISSVTDAAFVRQSVSYKIADGTEGSSFITGMSGSAESDKILLVFRPASPASTVVIASSNSQITDGLPASQTVTASAGSAPLIVLGCWGSEGSVIAPRTMVPAKDDERASGTDLYFAWKICNNNPANVSFSMEDEGSDNTLQSFYAEIS